MKRGYYEIFPVRIGLRLLACVGLCGAISTVAAAPVRGGGVDPKPGFTALQDGIPHPSDGCEGTRVLTPQPGTQFADPVNVPDSVASFYATAARLNMPWVSTMHCTQTGVVHWPALSGDDDGGDQRTGQTIKTVHIQPSWSGYLINNLAHYVQSGWTVPTVVNPPLGHRYSQTGYASSIWAGMGGGAGQDQNDLPLIQAGTTQYLSAAPPTATYRFWYEIVGPGGTPSEMEISPLDLAVYPGDVVGSISLWFEDTQTTEFGLCNYSHPAPSGACIQAEWNCPDDGHCVEGPGTSTTEWMVEAPNNNYTALPLADFGSVDFYNGCWCPSSDAQTCYAISQSGVTVPEPFWIQQKPFGIWQVLARPGQITSGSSFTVTYYLPSDNQ